MHVEAYIGRYLTTCMYNFTITFPSSEREVSIREADEVELWEGHARDKVDALRVLPLVHQLLVWVCIYK